MFNIEKSYWNSNGKFQKEYEELSKLTPDIGLSDDIYIDLLTATCNMYYRYYNDGDSEISERNQIKLQEGLDYYKNEIIEFLEDKKHYKKLYLFIDSEESLEDLVNAIIQLGVKEKLVSGGVENDR